MKKIIVALLLIGLFSPFVYAEPLNVENIETYAVQTSTETAILLIPERPSRVAWEIEENENLDDIYWYSATFSSTTIGVAISTTPSVGFPRKILKKTSFSDSNTPYEGDIWVMSGTSTTTIRGSQKWK